MHSPNGGRDQGKRKKTHLEVSGVSSNFSTGVDNHSVGRDDLGFNGIVAQ
jgi:hypothetical protein